MVPNLVFINPLILPRAKMLDLLIMRKQKASFSLLREFEIPWSLEILMWVRNRLWSKGSPGPSMAENHLLWPGLKTATFTSFPVVVQRRKLPEPGVRKTKDSGRQSCRARL